MTTELIPVGKPAFCDANVQFLMCDIHVSAQEAQEITGGHVLVCQQAACNGKEESMDNQLEEHVLVGFCSGLHPVCRGTYVPGYLCARPCAGDDRSPTKSLHTIGSRSVLMVIRLPQFYLSCSFFFVALCVCV